MNWKFILRILGLTLLLESGVMFLSAGVAWYYGEPDLQTFIWSSAITFCASLTLTLSANFRKEINLIIGKRESYIGVSFCWISFALFGALPFHVGGVVCNFSEAFFEAMSGITTTGASVMRNIEQVPHGLLFWRNIMQWLGGIGIVVSSLALLPFLGGSASQLFDAESSGLTHDKFRPRVTQMAKRLFGMYVLFTMIAIVLLYLGPMNLYDSVCHTLSTISTGGFSTKQNSIAYWDSLYIESILIVFMIIGGINFPLLYFLLIRWNFKKFFKDEELRWFLSIIVVSTLLTGSGLFVEHGYETLDAFRKSLFQIVSIITTTGFTTDTFSQWGYPYTILFLFLMFFCGCAGSTSGGLKVVRAVVLAKNTANEFKRLIHPHAIISVRLNSTALSFDVVQRLLAFVFLYMSITFFSWVILTLSGVPFEEALGTSISIIGNVGLGIGNLVASYASLPPFALYYSAFLMLIGRLEIFTILILFTPGFWKK